MSRLSVEEQALPVYLKTLTPSKTLAPGLAIACVAHGIAIGAIPPEQSAQLLYGAQVAICALRRTPKPSKFPSPELNTPPLPPR
jgi:hypothetical protein